MWQKRKWNENQAVLGGRPLALKKRSSSRSEMKTSSAAQLVMWMGLCARFSQLVRAFWFCLKTPTSCQCQCCKQATQDMSALHSSSLSSAAKNEGGGALEGSINRAGEAAGQWRIYNDESKKLLPCFQFSNSSR